MSGFDRATMLPLDNLTHTLQSVEVILSTGIGSRVMRRQFGGGVAELLGRAVKPSLMAIVQQVIGTAIDLWEPRLHVRRVSFSGSADAVRRGTVGIVIEADYRPRGHLGDFTIERNLSFSVRFAGGSASASVI